jgi:Fe-S-cluster-containing dehydrogenase component/DMSO reductase anchor subunit
MSTLPLFVSNGESDSEVGGLSDKASDIASDSSSDSSSDRVLNLVDFLLAEQQALPAVETFARRHGEGSLSPTARVYEERIPDLSALRPGQQLSFRVDLDACTGCKACVTACHSMNGLAPEETWRDVGLVVGDAMLDSETSGFQQTVTTACHHCEDPACLSGCPVQAYEKDPTTGIVRHLDDQCIGCQYCILKCPYDVPKFSAEMKIVRKCDMCTGRLAVGEAPACVQGCPNGAIAIEIVDVKGAGPIDALLPGSNGSLPDSAYTRPTTRYVSKRPTTPLRPADLESVRPADAHDPLAIMLVLLQLSVGTLAIAMIASASGLINDVTHAIALFGAAASALLGLGCATLHLGRPLYAFRAFLGWRTSWMSREILVVGAYVPAVLSSAVATTLVLAPDAIPGIPSGLSSALRGWLPLVEGSALGMGLLGTVCSMMIYVDTHRRAWALSRTAPLFLGTLAGLGALGVATSAAFGMSVSDTGAALPLLLLGVTILGTKVALELASTKAASEGRDVALARGAQLLRGVLRPRFRARVVCAALGLLAAGAGVAFDVFGAEDVPATLVLAALAFFAVGELIERHLYFTAEASPGMPGR